MTRIIGRISASVLIESVVRESDGELRHVYRLVGGPDDGREFDSLVEMGDYAFAHAPAVPA